MQNYLRSLLAGKFEAGEFPPHLSCALVFMQLWSLTHFFCLPQNILSQGNVFPTTNKRRDMIKCFFSNNMQVLPHEAMSYTIYKLKS